MEHRTHIILGALAFNLMLNVICQDISNDMIFLINQKKYVMYAFEYLSSEEHNNYISS